MSLPSKRLSKYIYGSLVILVAFLIAIVGVEWGLAFLIENEKVATEDGFFIKDTPRPFTTVEYRFDRKQKTEKIHQSSLLWRSFSVIYSGNCDCVLSFNDFDAQEFVHKLTSEEYSFNGRIIEEVLPRENGKVKRMLEEGKRLRDEMRKKYAKYFLSPLEVLPKLRYF